MTKLKNNVLLKNILILLISGGIAKVIGMVGKIVYTRIAGVNIVGLYTLITPTLMLIITLTQFSFPISISKLSAEGKHKNADLLKNAYVLGAIINIILIILVILSCKLTASLLHAKELWKAFLSITIIIPFIMVSSVQRGFLHGKENMLPASVTNVTEEIIKIVLIIMVLPYAVLKGSVIAIITIILFNVITEVVSIIIMQKSIKKSYIKKEKGNFNVQIIKEILNISLPTTSVRLISSLGFFLEPIILTNVLLKTGFDTNYITTEYGIINSYITPLLSIPSFFSMSIASALLPNITKAYTNKKYKEFNAKLLKLMFLSLFVGLICLTVIMLFPEKILTLIYNINVGVNYIYLIGPFFLLLYMQPTLSVAMQAMDKTSNLLGISVTSLIIKYVVLISFGLLGFGMNALIYAMISGVLVTTGLMIFTILKNLNKKL